jgi:hypothetical protein
MFTYHIFVTQHPHVGKLHPHAWYPHPHAWLPMFMSPLLFPLLFPLKLPLLKFSFPFQQLAALIATIMDAIKKDYK